MVTSACLRELHALRRGEPNLLQVEYQSCAPTLDHHFHVARKGLLDGGMSTGAAHWSAFVTDSKTRWARCCNPLAVAVRLAKAARHPLQDKTIFRPVTYRNQPANCCTSETLNCLPGGHSRVQLALKFHLPGFELTNGGERERETKIKCGCYLW